MAEVLRAWYIVGVVLNVAVVEDEEGIRQAVSYALTREGYTVTGYPDGASALDAWHQHLPDLIILDILMPHVGGLEVCRRVRQRSERVPIIFLTSRADEIDRVLGLELGADDYVCKPFSMRELVARVHALERRLNGPDGESNGPPVSRLSTGSMDLDPAALRCLWRGERIPLTVTEFRILEMLVRNPGTVISRDQLLAAAYPLDVHVTDRSIDSHIRRIRRKLQEADPEFSAIHSVYGAGYTFTGDPP